MSALSEDADVVITGILLAPAKQSELKSNVCCVKEFHVTVTFSYSTHNRHDMTSSVIEISEVGVQAPEWRVKPHLYVRQYV